VCLIGCCWTLGIVWCSNDGVKGSSSEGRYLVDWRSTWWAARDIWRKKKSICRNRWMLEWETKLKRMEILQWRMEKGNKNLLLWLARNLVMFHVSNNRMAWIDGWWWFILNQFLWGLGYYFLCSKFIFSILWNQIYTDSNFDFVGGSSRSMMFIHLHFG
jgi:hypothetical protein